MPCIMWEHYFDHGLGGCIKHLVDVRYTVTGTHVLVIAIHSYPGMAMYTWPMVWEYVTILGRRGEYPWCFILT